MREVNFHGMFCDDIRHEVGNKITLVGCYGNELFFNEKLRALPRLCAHFSLAVFDEEDPEGSQQVTVEVLVGKKPQGTVHIDAKVGQAYNGGFEIQPLELVENGTVELRATIGEVSYLGALITLRKAVAPSQN